MDTNIHKEEFLRIFNDLHSHGKMSSPRGEIIKELENYSYKLSPYVRFQNFENRKFNLSYMKKEFLWYLKGDRHDLSICNEAKIWGGIVNSDGSINSNYGQYIFGNQNQYDNVVKILKGDRDSRRASITILNSDHLFSDTKDIPCTYSINFRIRDGKLNMTVHMRSQDAIYGMANDAPSFSFLHEMMLHSLKEYYSYLECGDYYHFADSFHVYKRHFKMLEKIIESSDYVNIDCPKISSHEEVSFLRKLNFKEVPEAFEFTKWLIES